MKRLAAAFGAALLLLVAPAAVEAQTSPRQEQLATELTAAMLPDAMFDGLLRRALPQLRQKMSGAAGWKPEWNPLMEQAVVEEVRHKKPRLQVLMGRAIFSAMTEPELEAGLALMRTRGGQAMLASASLGGGRPELSPAEKAEMERILRSPEGRSFAAKIKKPPQMSESFSQEFASELFPGVMRRFGEKVEALEKR